MAFEDDGFIEDGFVEDEAPQIDHGVAARHAARAAKNAPAAQAAYDSAVEPSAWQSVKGAVAGLVDSNRPSPAMLALAGPAGIPAALGMHAGNKLFLDDAIEGAASDAPGAFLGGQTAALVPLAAGARGISKTLAKPIEAALGKAVGKARLGYASATTGDLAKLVESIPGGGGAAKLLKAAPKAGPSSEYAAMLEEQLAEPVADLAARPSKSSLRDLVPERTPTPFPVNESAAARAARIEAQAEALAAEREASRGSDLLKGTRESRTPKPAAAPSGPKTKKARAPKPATPRAAAVEKLIAEEAPAPRVRNEMDPENTFMRQLREAMPEPAAPSAAASIHRPGPSMSSVPAAPATKMTLKQAVQDGVRRGVGLKELAKELGVTQGDIGALFKGAQLGY